MCVDVDVNVDVNNTVRKASSFKLAFQASVGGLSVEISYHVIKASSMEFTEVVEESFKASARIGRRNAVGDIDKADPNAKIAALVQELQNLLPFNDYSTSQGAADHCNHCVAVDQT
ncbi:hypothetical protein T05_6977 [Trichinella murrelli]|uniref:Uncharacterized protein n=1 Tax=Trichinella murrelli TaxID=144512 RepID=A0A0V0TVW9_9BILA|nr:hypothetical protein T05_6977 [Trichinella murrelli]